MANTLKDGQEIIANVYCLKHEGVPIYVGCTTRRLEERLNQYFLAAHRDIKSPLYDYINKNSGFSIELIEQVKYTYDNRIGHLVGLKIEDYWIHQFSKKWKLFNSTRRSKNPITRPTNQVRSVERKEKIVASGIIVVPRDKVKERLIIAINIKNARKVSGLTQQAASDLLNIKRSSLGAYEEGRAEPAFTTLQNMCRIYKIDSIEAMYASVINFLKSKSNAT